MKFEKCDKDWTDFADFTCPKCGEFLMDESEGCEECFELGGATSKFKCECGAELKVERNVEVTYEVSLV